MCVIDRVPVRTDCLPRSETTARGVEEHGCVDTATCDMVSLQLGGLWEPSKNTIRTYLQMERVGAARQLLRGEV